MHTGPAQSRRPTTSPSLPPPPFLNGWSYRKLHTIAGSTSGALTDYQVRFKVYNTTGTDTGENVYLGSNVKPDFSDLRFTTNDNTVLTYWVQETGSNYAVVWVKVPTIPTTGTQMYLYYGNPSAPSLSNGDATFLLFDHFDAGSVNSARWTKSGDVTVSGSIATLNAPDETMTSVPVFGVNTALVYPSLDQYCSLGPGRVWR